MFANGYKSNPIIEKISIDSKVKCKACKVVKTSDSFSKKNLYHLKGEIYTAKQAGKTINTTQQLIIPCISCTPQQQFEFRCYGPCGKVKGRNRFSKAQLKNPDQAYCWECMQARANMEPGMSSDDDDGDESDDSRSSGGDSDGAALPSTMAGVSVGGTSHTASNSATPAASVAGGTNTTTASTASAAGFAKVKTITKKVKYDVTNLSPALGVTKRDYDDVQVADSSSESEDQ